MNNNKLKDTVANKSSVQGFCLDVGMSETGYYKMSKNEYLKVETLEKFTEAIGYEMDY